MNYKKILGTCIAAIICSYGFSQTTVPNGGFENWQNVGALTEEPTNWNANKTGGGFANFGPQTCFREATDPHSGTYCTRLTNGQVFASAINATATTGRIEAPTTDPVDGYIRTITTNPDFNSPFTGRPDSLVGWFRFDQVGSDIGRIQAFLHDNYNFEVPDQGGSAAHQIAEAVYDLPNGNTTSWTRFSVPFNYASGAIGNATPTHILLICTASSSIGGASIGTTLWVDDIMTVTNVRVAANVFLDGPYNSGSMSDALRSNGLVPTSEPYTALGYNFVGGGDETIDPTVLNVTGNDAIVDWIVMELRSASNSANVVASRSLLLQRDGDLVDLDGTSDAMFSVPPGNYFVAIRHRNHLGVMATPAVALSEAPTTVDFTSAATSTYGTEARKNVAGTQVLWAGDVSFNGEIRYTGSGNDRDPILVEVGGSVPTNVTTGYRTEDVNMNGEIRYTGANNDRDPILVNVGGSVPTNTRQEQLP